MIPEKVNGQFEYGYVQGAIITQEKDTIWGQIMDRKEGPFERYYEKVRFKPEKGRKRKYGPNEISGYIKNGRYFESKWFHENWEFFRQNIYSRENLGQRKFLLVVNKGNLERYIWEIPDEDDSGRDFITLLKKSDSDEFVRARQGIFGLNRKRLIEYFDDRPELQQKIANKEINDIDEIIDFYNLQSVSL